MQTMRRLLRRQAVDRHLRQGAIAARRHNVMELWRGFIGKLRRLPLENLQNTLEADQTAFAEHARSFRTWATALTRG
jgi:hypothetical protein